MIANECSPEASVIWGVAFDPELEDEMRITIVATGFEKKPGDATRDIKPAAEGEQAEAAEEAAEEAPAKPKDELDLDDLFGDIFGKN